MTKVGKSDGEGTFPRTRGNDKVVPLADLRAVASNRRRWALPGYSQVAATENAAGSFAALFNSDRRFTRLGVGA
jgi:hypothetical protein